MLIFRLFFKSLFWLFMLVSYLSVSSLIYWTSFTEKDRRRRLSTNASRFVRWFLKGFNIEVRLVNAPDPHKSYMMVGNHFGILEIFALLSRRPAMFVTSMEMRNAPVIGYVTRLASCYFIERRNRDNLVKEVEGLRQTLLDGFSVVIYPEGTSTNCEMILPFKKSLLVAAAGTEKPILPLVANFIEVNGEPMSWKYRDHVCWYGDHGMGPYALKIMSMKSAVCQIEFLEPITCHTEEDRRQIASHAQAEIEKRFHKIPLGPGEVSTFVVPKWMGRTDQGQ